MAGITVDKLYKEFFNNEVNIEDIMEANEHQVSYSRLKDLVNLCDHRAFLIKHILEKTNG